MNVIFDIDRCLADNSHREHLVNGKTKNWDEFYEECVRDKSILPTIKLLRCLHACGNIIFLVTGRPEKIREETERWLEDRKIPYQELLMRYDNSFIKDDKLKKAILDKLEDEGYQIDLAFDDSDAVIEMYRMNNIIAMQCNEDIKNKENKKGFLN